MLPPEIIHTFIQAITHKEPGSGLPGSLCVSFILTVKNQRNTAGKASMRSEAIKLYSDFSWAAMSPAKPWM